MFTRLCVCARLGDSETFALEICPMPRDLIQFEIEAVNLKAEMEDLAALIAALIGETVAVQVRAAEAILLAGKLADGLADAIEAGG